MVKIEQKFMEKDGKTIGYVAVTLVCETGDKEYSYPLKFDDKTRKRFNIYARSLGYQIGEINRKE